MSPADLDRVFGRARLRMVTGEHVEVFREASLPGERRRYTKRFLATAAGDFREWTEREWRILARLVGHGVRAVPQVVQFDRGAAGRTALVQTYDAGVTVDHWATLLPLERGGVQLRNVFEDCAHWWALARHCLIALDAIHALQLVHLDLKADNVCVPLGPSDFDPLAADGTLQPRFDDLALIDFAFSLVSGEPLESALPIARQAEYEYQSPRLLRALDAGRAGDLAPTRQLDWRCDLFSLAAMLWRYLPELEDATHGAWTRGRHAKARALVRRLVEAHDGELPALRPHAELIAFASEALAQPELAESLQRGWRLVVDSDVALAVSPTPVTRIAMPVTTRAAAPTTATAAAVPAWAVPSPASPSAAPAATSATAFLERPAEGAAASGAAPWFFGAGAPLRVDPTDVEVRARLHRATPTRMRRAAWASGIALVAAAVASVPVVAPEWLELPGVLGDAPATRAAARAPARAAAPDPQPNTRAVARPGKSDAGPPVVVAAASPPAETKPPPPIATTADAAHSQAGTERSAAPPARAAIDATRVPVAPHEPTSTAAAPAAKPTTTEPDARPAPPAATRTASKATPLARSAPGGTATATASAPPKPVLARNARVATAPAAAAAAASGRSRPQVAAATPQRPPVARTWQDPAAPIPWAVAGRAAPRLPPAKPLVIARAPSASGRAAIAAPLAVAATTPAQAASAAATNAAPATVAAAPSSGDGIAAPTPGSAAPAATAPATVNVVAATRDLQPAPFPATRARDPAATAGGEADALVVRANDVMVNHVPRLAQQAERSIARVLYAAGRSEHVRDDDEIRSAAAAVARSPDPLAGMTLLPRDAQQLNDQARAEYARRGSTRDVLMLQVRAFGANPMDAEVAGNLAFLLLRQRPAQADAARLLALHALTLRGTRPDGRIEDWATLAIASALTGRERDARNALLVTLALAPNLDRQCKAALDVVALYGERLRAPVEAMLQSAQSARGAQQSAFCEWPPHWVVSGGR